MQITKKFEKIHITGICGVLTHSLAIALKKAGFTVRGSDAGFFPPVSTYLKEENVTYYPGWHPEKMIAKGTPDLVIMGGVGTTTNPERNYVEKHNIPYVSAAQMYGDYFVQKESIVVVGTYGKTTTTALLVWIMKQANHTPSYMFGGLSCNAIPASSLGNITKEQFFASDKPGGMSILEGDEYQAASWDKRSKFWLYSPKHIILTAAVWDHADLFTTEQSYLENFQKLINNLPPDGSIVASEQASQALSLPPTASIYGTSDAADYQYSDVQTTKQGITLTIKYANTSWTVTVPVLGAYWAENITASFARAHTLGVEPQTIIDALSSFAGIKRRLEKRLDGEITILDDIAHSPTKATASLATIASLYSGNVIAIFEPNQGARRNSMLSQYDTAFSHADMVIIPRLTKIKTNADDPDKPIDGAALTNRISQTHAKTQYIDSDEALVAFVAEQAKPGDVIVFLGSHGFRGMIEELVATLK